MAKKKNDIDVVKTSKLLKAIADSDRLRLVLQLRNGQKNVGTLANAIKAEIVNVSHHLGVLRSSGVVKDKKIGRFVYYMLNPDLVSKSGSALHFRLSGATLIIN
jgi:ArsR family transcriptional regulator, nickel/cobalt-responsive transcriptional repressor